MKEYYSFKIPEPCQEDWNQMTPSAKGRFCSSCEKTVIDFTKMNAFEIGNYLKENQAKGVCGHINTSQLDQVILKIPATTIHQLRFSTRFFALALLIVMGTTLFSCVSDNGTKQKIDVIEIIDSTAKNSMDKPLSVNDNLDRNIHEETPIIGRLNAPPSPPVIVMVTGEIVSIEGAMVLEDHYSNEVPFAIVQHPPQFPNTPKTLTKEERRKYFSDNIQEFVEINFNKKVLDTTILGRYKIYTQFKIDATGQIVDIKVKAKYKVLEIEAFRVLRTLPNFRPGKDDDDNKVAVTYALPIIFEKER
ncbi:MAG: hypothetical protein ACI9WL_001628 [Rubritalea sp.]|jgi:hypothetical protein